MFSDKTKYLVLRLGCFLLLAFASEPLFGQYNFSGQVSEDNKGKAIYLSLVEDYRKSSRIYLEQIIRKTLIDSLGHFQFEGNNLLNDNRVYRIHLDGCSDESDEKHFLGQCNSSKSVLFIANNKDTVEFPTSFEDEALCSITSTNPKSSAFLEINSLKEEMIFDFTDYRSETNRKLNSGKWFEKFQDFGVSLNEPLAELYIFDFLSDKRNETFDFYLKDISTKNYYSDLLKRLQTAYPNTSFTQQYEAEITTDKQLATFNKPMSWDWKWIVLALFLLSVGLNVYLLLSNRAKARSKTNTLLQKLTAQEQKIVHQIIQDKSNKEIATELFVSHSTIKTHINNLYKKLEVSSRQEIIALFKK
ncbi:response regulator transcription factor [Flagellimonas eckloniae]|uniref:response regulator transcription factor n=1 Tax=Flagellimonas eckloniae TaxID=346185 RepID=UPI0009EC3852|nr:helix-turn-helix transcriptional regulator [Allomuricauda eckloniae]